MGVSNEMARAFIESHPDEAAAEMERMPLVDAAALLEDLPHELASGITARLSTLFAAECLRRLPAGVAGELLAEIPRDSGAALLRRLPADDRDRLLTVMPRNASSALARLTRFPEGTAGALMDPEVLAVPVDTPVYSALDQVRVSGARVLYYVYVVDRNNHLVGVVNLRELMSAGANSALGDVMRPHVERISVYADRVGALAHPAWRTFYALPVVDDTGLLVGVLRHKRLYASEDEAAADSPNLLAVGISLGEMYWSVAAQLLESLWPAARRTAEEPEGMETEIENER
ncbi:MAG TPA: CBS domain-containing protein [Terriglobia bacterium]|nr:CBS domain-containing protein [Terriglobia bacterium]